MTPSRSPMKVLSILSLLSLSFSPLLLSAPVEVNSLAAVANGRPITSNELRFTLAPIQARLQAMFPRRGQKYQEALQEQKTRILDELIARELILAEFDTLEGKIPEQFVDKEIQRQINNNYNGDKEKFFTDLKKAGLNKQKHRDLVYKKLIVQAMRSQQLAEISPPTEKEIRAAYDEFKVEVRDRSKDKITFRKIFIPANTNDPLSTPESQLLLAEDLAAKIRGGADFSALAKQFSADYLSDKGGQWPETPRTDLSSEFAAIIFDANEGELLGPIKEPAGFTIVEIQKKNLGPSPSYKELKPKVEEAVKRKKDNVNYEKWIKRLRRNAVVTIK